MIILLHNNNEVVDVYFAISKKAFYIKQSVPLKALFELAVLHPDNILVWCHENQKSNLNIEEIEASFRLKNTMQSYALHNYLSDEIGYVEDSPFLKVNKEVKFPTWLMSSEVGAIHASKLVMFKDAINVNSPFDYALNSISKLGMSKGLFCYSNPKLLLDKNKITITEKASLSVLFRFVKEHYKLRWIILLFINLCSYDKVCVLLPILKTIFYRKKQFNTEFLLEQSQEKNILNQSIDVIIPTIGRKQYLYDVLKDLKAQTQLPKQVIIVEQNPEKDSVTNLDYLNTEEWPFKITHKFIHKIGVCNARNLALKEVTSKYVYLADDDNRFDEHLLKKIIKTFETYKFEAISMSYLQYGEIEKEKHPIQWATFGGGCSVINTKYLDKIEFNTSLEFGYGEDADFGMQLRNCGADIIYFPEIKILHLKAPLGGFRTQFKQDWEHEEIQPKPSPTIMLNRLNNKTKHQLLGYKTTLFFKYYKDQNVKNPIQYFKAFKREWQQSLNWANRLKN